VYDSKPGATGCGSVWVQRYLYKLVYDESAGRAW
jgi:hypothetical protein